MLVWLPVARRSARPRLPRCGNSVAVTRCSAPKTTPTPRRGNPGNRRKQPETAWLTPLALQCPTMTRRVCTEAGQGRGGAGLARRRASLSALAGAVSSEGRDGHLGPRRARSGPIGRTRPGAGRGRRTPWSVRSAVCWNPSSNARPRQHQIMFLFIFSLSRSGTNKQTCGLKGSFFELTLGP